MPEVALKSIDYSMLNPFAIRQENFPNEITFYGPGLKPHKTSEFSGSLKEFVSISVTGNNCALNCEHCNTKMLDNMLDLPAVSYTHLTLPTNREV